MTIRHDAQIPTYSYLPDRDPRGFIRTGGSIPPWFFDSDDFFHFWTLWVLSGLWFFEIAWRYFYKEDFSLTTPMVFQI